MEMVDILEVESEEMEQRFFADAAGVEEGLHEAERAVLAFYNIVSCFNGILAIIQSRRDPRAASPPIQVVAQPVYIHQSQDVHRGGRRQVRRGARRGAR